MILKFLCLVLGLAMIGASFYQSWEEGLGKSKNLSIYSVPIWKIATANAIPSQAI